MLISLINGLVCVVTETAKKYTDLYQESQDEIAKLKSQLILYKRHIFRKKSERYLSSTATLPGQHVFDSAVFGVSIPEEKVVTSSSEALIETPRVKQKPVRKELDESDFEVITEELQPEMDTSLLKFIGKEVSMHQMLVDAKIVIKKIIRYKYQNTETGEIIMSKMPYRPFAKSAISSSIVSEVLVQKFVDGLPIYRQMQSWARLNVDFPYSTLSDMQRMGFDLIKPLYDSFKNEVLNTNYLQVDESPIKVLKREGKGGVHLGYHWVYLDPVRNLVFYDYRPARSSEHPENILKDFKGIIQTDGFAGYNKVGSRDDVEQISCMAHARRYFYNALDNDKKRASHFMDEVQKLYIIERKIKENNLVGEQIISFRQEHALPILQALHRWLKEQGTTIIPKSSFGKAVTYCLNRWEALMSYCNYPYVAIDNNPVEGSILPMVIGRKNYLFCGSDESAGRTACFYTFFLTCRLHNINPKEWIEDVFN